MEYLNDIQPLLQTPARAVWIDESSFHLSMARRYARAHRSERATDRLPANWGKNQTLICALQASGPFAAFIFEGAVNGDAFVWYVEHILCPALTEGQVVILDNLSAYHREEVIDLIEHRGCTVQYLPTYSPDFNPIEMLFSKVKALVRAGRWRELRTLWEAVWKALEAVSLQDVYGWITAAHPSALLCKML